MKKVWLKNTIRVGEGVMCKWLKRMVEDAEVLGDITNKSGRVTTITRMLAAPSPSRNHDHCHWS